MGAQDKEYINDDNDDNDAGINRLKNINNNDINNDDEKGSSGQIISLSSNGSTTTTTDPPSQLPLNNDQRKCPGLEVCQGVVKLARLRFVYLSFDL